MADESAFRAAAHPVRRRILDNLRRSEQPVSALIAPFRLSRQAMSQHLRILRTSGLVQQRRAGRGRVYAIVPARLREIHAWIAEYEPLLKDARSKRPKTQA